MFVPNRQEENESVLLPVIPATAGIQLHLDSRLCGCDYVVWLTYPTTAHLPTQRPGPFCRPETCCAWRRGFLPRPDG